MTTISEFRVRPVNRFVLTHYTSESNSSTGRVSGGVRTIGEFPNADAANEVAEAMRGTALAPSAGPGDYPAPPDEPSCTEYVIVGSHPGDESTIAHYAYSEEDAAKSKAHCEAIFGGTFSIFSRSRGG